MGILSEIDEFLEPPSMPRSLLGLSSRRIVCPGLEGSFADFSDGLSKEITFLTIGRLANSMEGRKTLLPKRYPWPRTTRELLVGNSVLILYLLSVLKARKAFWIDFHHLAISGWQQKFTYSIIRSGFLMAAGYAFPEEYGEKLIL